MKSFFEYISEQIIDNPKSIAHGHDVNTNPSEKQIKAGTYKKAPITIDGMDIAIENPLGTTRFGIDPDGKKWSITMKSDYGYIKGSVGFDKDHVDVFVVPGYKGGNDVVHVINQVGKDGSFDEHKCIIGCNTSSKAMSVYLSNYEKGWTGGKSVIEMPLDAFKKWVYSNKPKSGEIKEPVSEFYNFSDFNKDRCITGLVIS